MYGYEMDYDMSPASEGLGEKLGGFFSTVWKKITEFAKWIKNKMKEVALKIRRMTGTTSDKEVSADSAEATKTINEIEASITAILDGCCVQIEEIYKAYEKVGKHETYDADTNERLKRGQTFSGQGTRIRSEKVSGTDIEKLVVDDYTKSYAAKNGMDKLDKDAKNDNAKMSEWNNAKEKIGIELMKQKGEAEKVSTKLKSLAKLGPLTLSATKSGYDTLREIFNANGKFGARWKKVKIAAEWSTGDIKAALNKVVSMYDVGVRATNAFGNRLASGNFRGEDGKKMDKTEVKGTKSEYAGVNKVYKHNKSRNDISTNRKDEKGFAAAQFSKESASILDRIYEMAYEDAMEDIELRAEALEAYDSVPGMYEFVEESVDNEYDPELDFDLI